MSMSKICKEKWESGCSEYSDLLLIRTEKKHVEPDMFGIRQKKSFAIMSISEMWGKCDKEKKDIAALLVAAPKMYKLLQKIMLAMDNDSGFPAEIRDCLRDARGRSK